MEKVFKVEGMMCEHCSARVERGIKELGYSVSVSLEKGEVTVSGDDLNVKEITEAIEDMGFDVK